MTLVNKLGQQDPKMKGMVTLFAAIDRDLKDALLERADKTRESFAYVIRETLAIGLVDDKEYKSLRKYARKSGQELPEIVHDAIKAYLKVNK